MGDFFEEKTQWLLEKLSIIEAVPLESGHLEIHSQMNRRKINYEFDRRFNHDQKI